MRFRVPRFIRRDFLRKLVATFFAVLIWLAVDNQLHDFVTVHDVPVTLRYEPDKLILERRVLTTEVTLRGSRKRLQNLKSTDVRITAEVPVVPDGVYHYDVRLSPGNVSSLPGTRVASINPESVRVQLDRIVSRDDVPVRVRETGELGPGYRALAVRTVPSTVTVTGPGKILQDVSEIVTEPILLDETVIHSFEQAEVRLMPVPRAEVHPDTVLVAYEIAKHSGQQDFAELPIQVMGANRDLRPQAPLPPANVRLRGAKAIMEALEPHAVHPFIDTTAVTSPGRYTFRVNVWVESQQNLTVEHVHPEKVDVVLVAAKPRGAGAEPPPAQ